MIAFLIALCKHWTIKGREKPFSEGLMEGGGVPHVRFILEG